MAFVPLSQYVARNTGGAVPGVPIVVLTKHPVVVLVLIAVVGPLGMAFVHKPCAAQVPDIAALTATTVVRIK